MKNMILAMAIALAFGLAGCSSDKTVLNDQSGRISDLERRMSLNEQLDQLQSQLIQQNSDALAQETQSRIDGDALLQSLLDQEEQARIAGDAQTAAQLQAAAVAQSIVNLVVQGQIALLNSKFGPINTKLTSLQNQINNVNSNLNSIQSSISSLQVELSGLEATQQATATQLNQSIATLQAQVNAQKVEVYKCNASQSKENFLKIGGNYYGVMNRVAVETVQVVTGSSSQVITTPKLCRNSGDQLKLPDSSGNCNGGGWSVVPGSGTSTTVAAYTTANKTVVTSVQMDLEKLEGSYITTDGQASCSFSVNNGVATNLILAQ